MIQKYLTNYHSVTSRDAVELGASIALQFGVSISTSQRGAGKCSAFFSIINSTTNHIFASAPVSGTLSWKPDRSKALTSQIACKEHFAGEPDGFRLCHSAGLILYSSSIFSEYSNSSIASHSIEKMPPSPIPPSIRDALKTKMAETVRDIQNKTSVLTIQDLKRLLFRCASILISTPQVRK
jgi:phosphatidylinositol 4-kinase A